jgi:DNA helicase IV
MRTHHPDFAIEQKVIEHAHDCHQAAIANERGVVQGKHNAGADAHAQREIRKLATRRLEKLEGTDTRRLVVGRLDFQDETRRTIYIGPITVMDDDRVAVVDFTRDIARGYYRATEDDPMGLARKRNFDVNGRVLIDISDEVFAALREKAAADGTPTVPSRTVLDGVAAELELAREPHMRQIIATIVADQYRMIEAPRQGVMVIQGGPGTGKTAVALHRAVFLIRRNEALGKVLVVGPNAAFMAYIAEVLPGLGEREVDQTPIDRLAITGEVARATGEDPRGVAAVKGDAKMAEIVRRTISARIRPVEQDIVLRAQSLTATFPAEDANELLEAERRNERPYMEGRRRFVEAMRGAAEDLLQARLSRFARRRGVDRARVRVELTADREWSNILERMWPTAAAAGVIHDLLTTEQRLRDASSGVLRESEVQALVRRGVRAIGTHPFSRADLALIDEAHALLQGPEATYGYVIVDEAQDLTPMELRMVARRSRAGDMTLVGDIAQATGPCRPDDWDAIIAHLPQARGVNRDELTIGYRVPRSMMELANVLLPRIAPALTPTEPVREARFDPTFRRVTREGLSDAVAATVTDIADEKRSVGVIVPASQVVDVRGALALSGIGVGDISTDQLEKRVTLLTSGEAKGLEFDHVVVVEPMTIVTETPTGWSELYVALTRATQQLAVVHANPLPAPLPGGVEPEFDFSDDGPTVVEPFVGADETDVEVDFDLDVDLDLPLDRPPSTEAPPAEPTPPIAVEPGPDHEPSVISKQGLSRTPAAPTRATESQDTVVRPPVTPVAEPGPPDAQAATRREAEPIAAPDRLGVERPTAGILDEAAGLAASASSPQRVGPSSVRLGGDFSEALVLAKLTHGDARRAGTAIPYLSHLLGTTALVLEDGGTEIEAVAALLHDAVEDGPPGIDDTIRRRFGPAVADVVIECTDPTEGSFRERKEEHIRRLEAGSGSARRVALAEKLDNARGILRDLERYGPEVWKVTGVEKEEHLWYLRALVVLFGRAFPSVLATEFERAVDRIEQLAGDDL